MQGDSFHFAFPLARDAARRGGRRAAGVARARLGVRSRSASASGCTPASRCRQTGLYAGLDVHRAARVMSAAHGGQVLLSQRTADLVDGELRRQIELLDLGEHRLKDLSAPQRLYQAVVDGLPTEFPPLRTLHVTNLPIQPNSLIGGGRSWTRSPDDSASASRASDADGARWHGQDAARASVSGRTALRRLRRWHVLRFARGDPRSGSGSADGRQVARSSGAAGADDRGAVLIEHLAQKRTLLLLPTTSSRSSRRRRRVPPFWRRHRPSSSS